MILKDFPEGLWKTTPLRLALRAGCKPFFEEDDACVEGLGLGGCGVLPGVGAVFAGGVLADTCFDAGPPPGGQQVAQGGPADCAGQVGGPGGEDVGGGGDQAPAVCSRMVKLIRSMSRPGRVAAVSAAARMSAW